MSQYVTTRPTKTQPSQRHNRLAIWGLVFSDSHTRRNRIRAWHSPRR
jgi:hypothetical protein